MSPKSHRYYLIYQYIDVPYTSLDKRRPYRCSLLLSYFEMETFPYGLSIINEC